MVEARQRIVGGILGLALGDALGAPFEFRRAHDVPRPSRRSNCPGWTARRVPGPTTRRWLGNLWTSLIATGGTLDTDDVLRRHLDVVEELAARRREPNHCRAAGTSAGLAERRQSRVRSVAVPR
jgi:hypothetical protein